MKKAKYDFLSVRIDNDVTKKLNARVETSGIRRSKLIREALDWYLNLSDGYERMVRAFSGSFSIPPSVVIENLGLETIAREQAEDKVLGGPSPIEIFPKQLSGEPITGFEFLNMREATWKAHYEQKLAEKAAQEQYLAEQAAQGQMEEQAG